MFVDSVRCAVGHCDTFGRRWRLSTKTAAANKNVGLELGRQRFAGLGIHNLLFERENGVAAGTSVVETGDTGSAGN